MSDLPTGWATVRLGDVANVVRGITFPAGSKESSKNSTNVCCLRTSHVQSTLRWDDAYYVPLEYVKRDDQFVQVGDILMSMANSYELVGKVAMATAVPEATAFGAFLSAVRPRALTSAPYLFHLLRSQAVQAALREGSSQTTNIANISVARLSEIEVPLAPLGEQQRIADKLDTVLARVDACRDRLARVAPLLKRFRQSVLAAAMSGRLTEAFRSERGSTPPIERTQVPRFGEAAPNAEEWLQFLPSDWTVSSAAEVVAPGAEIVYGIVQPGPKLANGVPYVRGVDIVDGKIQVDQLLRTSEEIASKYARASIRGGDVLLGIIRATKVAIVPPSLNGANITQGTARLRPGSSVLSRFLAIALEAPATQRWLHAHYRGIDMPGLNLADVRRTPIPLPPKLEQAEILRRVETLFAFADRLEARLAQAQTAVDRLTPALLAKAFRGELVPQDPADEPATELLKRLAAQREAAPARPRRKRATA